MVLVRLVGTLVDRALCVVGAVLFSQCPEFIQQYLQRLGGHLEEARRQLDSFDAAAKHADLPFERFVAQTSANSDPGISQLGTVMAEAADRTSALQTSYDALINASDWTRPFIFLRHIDVEIGRATAAVFRPAVPATMEGLVYATSGMLVLLGLYHLGLALVRRAFRKRRTTRAVAQKG